MRILLGFLFLGHAIAHLPGFVVNLELRSFPELPFRTTALGGSLELGKAGIRMVGLAWLMLAVAFVVLAMASFMRVPLWHSPTYVAITLSVVLCVLGWPDARIGLLANIVILLVLLFGTGVHGL